MEKLDLAQYVFESNYNSLKIPIINWLNHSNNFMNFFLKNKNKIRDKVRNVKKDIFKLDSVLAEIRIAFLLLCNDDFKLEYEFYGKKIKGPDFHVTYKNQHKFNIEVKYIERKKCEILFQQELDKIRTLINKIESIFYYGIEVNVRLYDEKILKRLQNERKNILEFITTKAKDPTACRCLNEIYKYPIDPFGTSLNLLLLRPFEPKQERQIAQLISSTKIPFTQNEFKKFNDTIRSKVQQLKEGIPNFIFVYTNNYTHYKSDMIYALERISYAIKNNDGQLFSKRKKDYGFSNLNEFIEMYKILYGMLFITEHHFPSANRNFLWVNEYQDKELYVPTEVLDYFKNMKDCV